MVVVVKKKKKKNSNFVTFCFHSLTYSSAVKDDSGIALPTNNTISGGLKPHYFSLLRLLQQLTTTILLVANACWEFQCVGYSTYKRERKKSKTVTEEGVK